MKNTITLAILLFAVTQLSISQGISFEKDGFNAAFNKAQESGKILFIDAYTTWCAPCKWMEKNTFLDEQVGQYFDEHLIAIKIDVERGNGPDIQKKYAIVGLPGYVFLDSKGVVLLREKGSKSVDAFMKLVKQAKEYADDPNNIGRLAERYKLEKDNEELVALYLDKLHETRAVNYTPVLEHYLSIQTTMQGSDKEMALLLAKHAKAIIYGGKADRIIQENFLSDNWRQVVRKDIRQTYQSLSKQLEQQTFEYAVQEKDSALIDVILERGSKKEGKAQQLLTSYYYQTGNGAAYKALQLPVIERFYNSLDIAHLKSTYNARTVINGASNGRIIITAAARKSQDLMRMATEFARYIESDHEKELILKWAYTVYDLMPDEATNIDFYANVMYLYGDRKQGIELKEKSIQLNTNDKRKEVYQNQLSDMKAGKTIVL
ncbi:thioredoxin family protein [Carboxylicivirga sp. RSCT41]|uniref:thioredoxin family protein n=1 Tax=Carboxylicivirga agarovorans TaxID=3417570 RepID=UPI003D34AB18